MISRVVITMLGLAMMGCGPAENANLPYAKDCFNGCGKSYGEYQDEFRGANGEDGEDSVSTHTVSNTYTEKAIPGPRGAQGEPGQDGIDGNDAVIYSNVIVIANSCIEVSSGIWVENIRNGQLLDVYYNEYCSDSSGEYCDNLVPSEAKTGSIKQYKGSGTICWAESTQISATKLEDEAVKVHLLQFAQEDE